MPVPNQLGKELITLVVMVEGPLMPAQAGKYAQEIIAKIGMTLLGEPVYREVRGEAGWGFTYFQQLKESALLIDTWEYPDEPGDPGHWYLTVQSCRLFACWLILRYLRKKHHAILAYDATYLPRLTRWQRLRLWFGF